MIGTEATHSILSSAIHIHLSGIPGRAGEAYGVLVDVTSQRASLTSAINNLTDPGYSFIYNIKFVYQSAR